MGHRYVTKMTLYLLIPVFGALFTQVLAQSNYASQANSIEYQPGLPPSTVLDGKVTKLDDISSDISLNRTKAHLNCAQGSMEVELKFNEAFYGVAYADFDRNSACMARGNGANFTKLELPLKGCGTVQDPQRVFTNNIVVRFHPGLEMEGDEVITIVCRYPPPVVIVPPITQRIRTDEPAVVPVLPAPLQGFQILLIICAILFLTLLLIGLGCSYMCLKRRNVRVIHRHPFSTGSGSEITKMSTSSLSNLSMIEGLKIPRAHALLHAAPSSSGSETNLVIDHSDTLPSDYPSESHSEVDEERSLPVSSAGSYDNKAFMHQQQAEIRTPSSLYSESVADAETSAMTAANASRIAVPRHPVALPIEPKFDVQMRVKRAPPPPPSPLPSESDASIALERNLTTILEREESARSMESPVPPAPQMTSFSYVPELHYPPNATISRQQTPPVYSRILRKQAEREAMEPPMAIHRPRSLTSLNTELTDTHSLTEVTDNTHARYKVASILAPTPPPPPSIGPSTHTTVLHHELPAERVEPLVEPVVAQRRPEITTHEVDDVFLRTVTEKRTIEDIERHRRQVTEYHARPQVLPDPKWDVTIRNYPTEELPPPPPEWENFSDISSASNLTITNEPSPHEPEPELLDMVDTNIEPTYTPRVEMPSRIMDEDPVPNWSVLIRVLEPQHAAELTEEERVKWREIITTESTLRTLLTEAVVKEDYELIRKDVRYTNLFSSEKWDVIIRILSPPSSAPPGKSGQRYKRGKGSEWDTRSRRSSLPTLYEYESDGGSSVRTLTQDQRQGAGAPLPPGRYRRLSSTTRGGSEADLRSMSEMTVRDFARADRDDLTSLSSYEGESLVRSLSQPSLARSGSEFTEHWGVPRGTWGGEDGVSSTETTPQPVRRMPYQQHHQQVTSSVFSNAQQGVITASGAPGTQGMVFREARYSETVRETQQQGSSSWFHDDSEPEMQI
ncbi:uncharacterized protein pot [Neodiprion pinetum]|uniref:uncharacterized protein pot n=1 Tax=Neodiprion pinetum TaxID=441929 RepID=UPI001EDD28CF|nr:uncharacterized protein LOC124215707 [Neodiprion pinetum]XP_046475365.1 uncharacterized protein LOC124215707 [Neodiprion pinetum]XP_046475366.1 uncharacterized protein LOC124215707 [Neodiprion pinetum]XP_046475367.1 uncharacterized protein LOC124215707 [Neodiprion pinetum]